MSECRLLNGGVRSNQSNVPFLYRIKPLNVASETAKQPGMYGPKPLPEVRQCGQLIEVADDEVD